MEGDRSYRTMVTEHRDERFDASGLPQGHFSACMAQADNSIERVEFHCAGGPKASTVVGNYLSCAYVLVSKLPKLVDGGEEEMFVEVLETQRGFMFLGNQ